MHRSLSLLGSSPFAVSNMAHPDTPSENSSPGASHGSGGDKSGPHLSSAESNTTGTHVTYDHWRAISRVNTVMEDLKIQRWGSSRTNPVGNHMLKLSQALRKAGAQSSKPDALGVLSQTTPLLARAAASVQSATTAIKRKRGGGEGTR